MSVRQSQHPPPIMTKTHHPSGIPEPPKSSTFQKVQHIRQQQQQRQQVSTPQQQQQAQQQQKRLQQQQDQTSGELSPDEITPPDADFILLILDYLRDLRRSYKNPEDMLKAEGIKADYITIAIYCLSRSFASSLSHPYNDPWMKANMEEALSRNNTRNPNAPVDVSEFPSLGQMTDEILLAPNLVDGATDGDGVAVTDENAMVVKSGEEEKKQNDEGNMNSIEDVSYEYDDTHASNAHRFYLLQGLASGPNVKGPLSLVDLATAGLDSLGSRSRIDAERDMISHPLFEQFLQAVRSKGFFKDSEENETPKDDPEEEMQRQIRQRKVYEERFGKVVAKFRSKLASKAQLEVSGNETGSVISANTAEWHQHRRNRRVDEFKFVRGSDTMKTEEQPTPRDNQSLQQVPSHLTPRAYSNVPESPLSAATGFVNNPLDIEEAERVKSVGNSHMQKKEYQQAAICYTKALKLSPAGPNSHVYYSNRAAALLSMKKFHEAILDSERSLSLKPNYGKAHARLGLAHFLLGDYKHAMEAYTVALKYEPNNKGAQSYLEKAAKRLAASEGKGGISDTDKDNVPISSSFSVVTECEKETRSNTGTTPSEGTRAL